MKKVSAWFTTDTAFHWCGKIERILVWDDDEVLCGEKRNGLKGPETRERPTDVVCGGVGVYDMIWWLYRIVMVIFLEDWNCGRCVCGVDGVFCRYMNMIIKKMRWKKNWKIMPKLLEYFVKP